MKYKKIVIKQIFILSVCLLTACQNKNGVDFITETEIVEKQSVESSGEPIQTTEYVTMPETAEEIMEKETDMRSETSEETTEENEIDDQTEYTWLDRALAECLEKKPGELTKDDYLSVTELAVYAGNEVEKNGCWINIGTDAYFYDNTIPVSIDITDIIPCKNLYGIHIELDSDPQPETYIYHYEKLADLVQLKELRILLHSDRQVREDNLVDSITDLSFLNSMENLNYIFLENIDLPYDLSPIFYRDMYFVALIGCNITDDEISVINKSAYVPSTLWLGYNQLQDVSNLTAMQDTDGGDIKWLDLSGNPLTNLGDFITWEKLVDSHTEVTDIYLRLYDTDFEEYTVEWMTD